MIVVFDFITFQVCILFVQNDFLELQVRSDLELDASLIKQLTTNCITSGCFDLTKSVSVTWFSEWNTRGLNQLLVPLTWTLSIDIEINRF